MQKFPWITNGILLVLLSTAELSNAETQNYSLCGPFPHDKVIPPGVTSGYIELRDGPSTSFACSLTLISCAECRINLQLVSEKFAQCSSREPSYHHTNCIEECDHLVVYDPDYEWQTRKFWLDNESQDFSSTSRRLTIEFCRKSSSLTIPQFRLKYNVYEKRLLWSAEYASQSFQSPFFPMGYSYATENVHYYRIVIPRTALYIHLWFDDMDLAPSSNLTVYHGSQQHLAIVTAFNDRRSYVVSREREDLLVVFHTGSSRYDGTYIGFNGTFIAMDHPVKVKDRPPLLSECGGYIRQAYGGIFPPNNTRGQSRDNYIVDCVWVIFKYPSNYFKMIRLSLTHHSFYGGDSLIVRQGNNSRSSIIYNNQGMQDKTGLRSSDALYIHFKGAYDSLIRLQGVFVSILMDYQSGGNCSAHYSQLMVRCKTGFCISNLLQCDGVDHCQDGYATDEICSSTTTRRPCSRPLYCQDGEHRYCDFQRCDSVQDCPDRADELNCFTSTEAPRSEGKELFSAYQVGTVVPIVLICLVLAVIACVTFSVFMRRKHRLNLRQRSQNQSLTGPTSTASLDVPRNIPLYPDAPPSYEETIYSAGGIFNMGYVQSVSVENLGMPPPYSQMAGVPYVAATVNPQRTSPAHPQSVTPSNAHHLRHEDRSQPQQPTAHFSAGTDIGVGNHGNIIGSHGNIVGHAALGSIEASGVNPCSTSSHEISTTTRASSSQDGASNLPADASVTAAPTNANISPKSLDHSPHSAAVVPHVHESEEGKSDKEEGSPISSQALHNTPAGHLINPASVVVAYGTEAGREEGDRQLSSNAVSQEDVTFV